MQALKIQRDVNLRDTDIINFSQDVIGGVLVANTAITITVPDQANIAIFSISGDFYCSVDDTTTATIPSGSASSVSVIKAPTARSLNGRTKLSLISAESKVFTITFYA